MVDDEARPRAEALGAGPRLAVAREHEQVGARGRRDDLVLDAAAALQRLGPAPEPLRGVGQQRLGGLAGDHGRRRPRRRAVVAPEQPAGRPGGERLDVAGGDDQQRDLSVGRHDRGRRVDARLPRGLGYPHDRAHQSTRRANHNPIVEARSTSGTVIAPSRVYSPSSAGSSWACRTRRHSSVASEPAKVRFGPTLTPMSIASTGPEPPAATTGSSSSVAGRLLRRFAAAAASAAIASSASRPSPCGTSASMKSPRPWSLAAATMTPSASTKTRKPGSAAATSSRAGGRVRSASTAAPAPRRPGGRDPRERARDEAGERGGEDREREGRPRRRRLRRRAPPDAELA